MWGLRRLSCKKGLTKSGKLHILVSRKTVVVSDTLQQQMQGTERVPFEGCMEMTDSFHAASEMSERERQSG